MFGGQDDAAGEIVRANPLMVDKELANGESFKGKVVLPTNFTLRRLDINVDTCFGAVFESQLALGRCGLRLSFVNPFSLFASREPLRPECEN